MISICIIVKKNIYTTIPKFILEYEIIFFKLKNDFGLKKLKTLN